MLHLSGVPLDVPGAQGGELYIAEMAAADLTDVSGSQAPPAETCILDGDTVILDINGEKQAFVTVKRNRSVRTSFL